MAFNWFLGFFNRVLTNDWSWSLPETDDEKKEKVAKLFEKYRVMAFADVETISCDDLKKHIEQKSPQLLLIDCRTVAEREVGKIPHAISKENVSDVSSIPVGAHVVCYCTIGMRSGQFAKTLLSSRGDLTVQNLHGGIIDWCHHEGILVDKNSNLTKKVHVYGKPWDLLPHSYESVW